MVILTVQFGQCGNQIGHSLFTYLANDIKYIPNAVNLKCANVDYIEAVTKRWFCENKSNSNCLVPRSVLVDTENKVISALCRNKNLLKYNNIVAKSEGGSANNWAYGYKSKGVHIKDAVSEMVRREIEKSDEIVEIFSILGSGGGTGSGVGSYIIESLRDEYPNKQMLNVVVLPYQNGEIVTQSYNTLLTLGKLYDITDGNILFENAQLHKTCTELLAIKNVDLNHINAVITQKISAVLQPVYGNSLSGLISQLTSHPSYKFVQIKTTPHIPADYMKYESIQGWPILIGHVRNTLRSNNLQWENKLPSTAVRTYPGVQYCKSVGSLLITRGGVCPEFKMLEPLKEDDLHAGWLPFADRLKHFHQPRNLYNTTNFLALASNNNAVCEIVETVIEQAWNLFNHKAYLHQYEKFGVLESDFDIAFEKLESIINSYRNL